MAQAQRRVDPSLLVVALFSRHAEALAWAEERLCATYGPLAHCGAAYPFHHTAYYEKEMGAGLVKRLISFASLVPSDSLADAKLLTIRLEGELAATGRYAEPRPLNLDPGLLQLGKFMLATTKDKDHRIYLRDGIFAEVTLRFENKEFKPWPWTYADYREPFVRRFLKEAREDYRRCLTTWRAGQDV
ncbi:MAG: DUF4416 family protein [Gemmataceae bacterium]